MADDSGVFLELLVYGIPIVGAVWIEMNKGFKKAEKRTRYENMLHSSENTASGGILDPRRCNDSVSFHNEHCALSINNETKQIFIGTDRRNVYGFDNIVNVEIEIDGNSVASPSIGGAIVGGVLFGGAGAIVGASQKTIQKKIKNVALKLYVDDLKNPYHRLLFCSADAPVAPNHLWVEQPLKEVNEWYSRFLNIIEKRKTASTTSNVSVADEIAKLSALLKDGAISQAEYDALKKKTLGI